VARACSPWARTIRRWYGRLGRIEVTDAFVLQHPSRHTVDTERWAAQLQAVRAAVIPVEPELGFEDLLEIWGHPA
jgi:hypothetical protein